MADWSQDQFMSNWDTTYVSTNVQPGAAPYTKNFFLDIHQELAAAGGELEKISACIIAAASIAVGRADIVGKFFDDVTTEYTPEKSEALFLRIREAISIIFPYVGIPQCIPACYGMIGVVQRKGQEYASQKKLRSPRVTEEDVQRGQELRQRIYSGVGNSEIFKLMDVYFTELFSCSTMVTWGYLISNANQEVFEVTESHLIVASAIIALGAARQSKSHVKATLGIGNSVNDVKRVVAVVNKIGQWAGKDLILPDVDNCAQQFQRH
ncbi:hypothetical protein BGW36DRAFT_426420 [Talaromyces proteolyticus]|uniref:Carboxymuconolactone decarboxylase-like domain-containing protein n=1 Tax=Talaromyces proteolyticus TaxID=1131652 RepID=A0AAD4Q1N4_9EURO|nr:uncharacterized protein BGW36DRAFT_426420 [Talaromyces proteolyticus]KAH8698728.1 hypothetical protein BGW36DRAFT_426420 [Talaromyces proteolyticus]